MNRFLPFTALAVYAMTLGYFLLVRDALFLSPTALDETWFSFLLYRFEGGLDFQLSLGPNVYGSVLGLMACGLLQIPIFLHAFKPKSWSAPVPEILLPFAFFLLMSLLHDALAIALVWSAITGWLFLQFYRWNDAKPLFFIGFVEGLASFSLVFSVALLGQMAGTFEVSKLFSQNACSNFFALNALEIPARYTVASNLGGISWGVAVILGMVSPWILRRREICTVSFGVSWVLFLLASGYLVIVASPCFGIENQWPISIEIALGFSALVGLGWLVSRTFWERFSLNFSLIPKAFSRFSFFADKGKKFHTVGFLVLAMLVFVSLLLASLFVPVEMP